MCRSPAFLKSHLAFISSADRQSGKASDLDERKESVESLETIASLPYLHDIRYYLTKSGSKRFQEKIRYNSMRIQLKDLAHSRSGDKGDTANIGLIALRPEYYPLLVQKVTAEAVKQHFGPMVKGNVERFELPNLNALNFLLHQSLGGGGTLSLMTDAQGKTFSTALLRMWIDLTPEEASSAGLG